LSKQKRSAREGESTLKIEHVAFQVDDPVAVAKWYVAHLGLTMKRAYPERPFGQFLADDGDAVMLEFYNNPKASVPDYRQIDPLVLHVAFYTDDIASARSRLLSAGATAEGDIVATDSGDHLAMLRDPWGMAVQLVHRAQQMI
jgi:glyoxylase I family protein